MGDHVTGHLTDEHQKVRGQLVNKDGSHISGHLSPKSRTLKGELSVGGIKDYNLMSNKPLINGVELIGDKSFQDLGLSSISGSEILDILNTL